MGESSISHPRTPPRNNAVQTPDTIVRSHHVSDTPYRTGDLSASRNAVIRDLGLIPEVSWASFTEILPPSPLSPEQAARVLVALNKHEIVDNKGEKVFTTEPAKNTSRESEVFRPLDNLFGLVVAACTNELGTRPGPYEWTTIADTTPKSARKSTCKPDAWLVLASDTHAQYVGDKESHYWEDCCLSAQFKKGTSSHDANDNRKLILWNMNHIMRNDPTRRFTYGMTIENTDLRMWLCHRAAVIVSEPVDFRNRRTIIDLFCRLAFARRSELGWDPTITRVYPMVADAFRYDILIYDEEQGEVVFKNARIIADFGADATCSRGTRVFETHSGQVVKDSWIDHDRIPEGTRLKDIRKAIEADTTEGVTPGDAQHFLTVIVHGYVKVDETDDHTSKPIMRGIDLFSSNSLAILQETVTTADPARVSIGAIPSVMAPSVLQRVQRRDANEKKRLSPLLKINHRAHYRVAFEERGVSLHDLMNFKEGLDCLSDTIRALDVLRRLGYVHRDVSPGNILRYSGRGILTDLEYIKHISDEGNHDVRSGTRLFMSTEVANSSYLYTSGKIPRGTVLKNNYLHDLESVWWVWLWFMLAHTYEVTTMGTDVEGSGSEYDPTSQHSAFNATFRCNDTLRSNLFRSDEISVYLEDLPPQMSPAAKAIVEFQEDLLRRYFKAEASLADGEPLRERAFEGAHVEAKRWIQKAAADADLGPIIPLSISLKRAQEPEADQTARKRHKA